MKTNNLIGLQKIFASAGKNPHGLDIEECLSAYRGHQIKEIVAVLILCLGALAAAGAGLACIFVHVSLLTLAVLCVGIAFAVLGFKIGRVETGDNVIRVARDWKFLVKEIQTFNLRVELLESGSSVASVFETSMKKLVGEILEAERLGKLRARVKTRSKLESLCAFARRLQLEVSPIEDFFKGCGRVEYQSQKTITLI